MYRPIYLSIFLSINQSTDPGVYNIPILHVRRPRVQVDSLSIFYLFIYLSINSFLSIYASWLAGFYLIYLSICISTYLSTHHVIYLSMQVITPDVSSRLASLYQIYIIKCLSILPIYLSAYVSVYLSIYYLSMQVMTPDESVQVGKISKQWTGMLKEAFTDADNFGIRFSKLSYLSIHFHLSITNTFFLSI